MAKTGRPPKKLKDYGLRPDWKEVVFNMSAEGCSDVEIRAALVWNKETKVFNHGAWDRLQDIDEEFSSTVKRAKYLCESWWEEQGRINLRSKEFQTALWFINMKNRFGWRDKQDVGLDIENAETHFKTIADAISKSDTNSK